MGAIQRPYSIQLELVRGCNRRCWFCGIHGLPAEQRFPNQFMDMDLLARIGQQLGMWLDKFRLELDLRGEPSLHPQVIQAVHTLRLWLPEASIQFQTNTESWETEQQAREGVEQLFRHGVNLLVLNCYQPGRADLFRDRLPRWGVPNVVDYYREPSKITPYTRVNSRRWYAFILDDLATIGSRSGKVSKRLHNTAGNSPKAVWEKRGMCWPEQPLQRRCTKVFREMSIHYDGIVPACCLDWNRQLVLGDLREQTAQQVWEGVKFQALRQVLYQKRRDLLLPCRNCDDTGIRPGLLPSLDHVDVEPLAAKLKEASWE